MELASQILSEITTFMKYSRYLPEKERRETWEEIVTRNKEMHLKKFPQLAELIEKHYKLVYDKKVLPSMRSMQFAGKAIEINPSRIYNCFSRETEFVTSAGVKSFNDFESGDKIKVLSSTGQWRNAVVRNYGKQKLNKISIKRGNSYITEIYATSNHKWILDDSTPTTELKIGDKLLPAPAIFDQFDYYESNPLERYYWCYGYVFGDGTIVRDRNKIAKFSAVRLCGKDKNYLDRFKECGFSYSSPPSFNGDSIVYTGHYIKEPPDLEKESPELVRAFVSGYLAADGAKNHDGTMISKYLSIQATGDKHNNFIKKAFPLAGVFITSVRNLDGQKTNFGIRSKNTNLYKISTNLNCSTNTKFTVKNIEKDVREEDVWCLEVERDHSFVLASGISTGNCSYLPINDVRAFSEIMFLLLGGTGVGYSVQKHHIQQLPEIRKPKDRTRRYLIGDSIEGWADAVRVLLESYFEGKSQIKFDYSDIRKKGARLVTAGGKAPGPEPLKICLTQIEAIMSNKSEGSILKPIEAHDIICHIADAVLSGGIRRASLIALFSADDEEMISCKYGNWYELNPQRGRANNSAVLVRHKIKEDFFFNLWKKIEDSHSGEPGIYFSNDKEWGCNPCVEIALRPFQMCNLCELNVSNIESQEDLNERVQAAAFIGTLQASYTDFHYLRPIWQRTCEKDALIGIGMTGIASNKILNYDIKAAAKLAVETNKEISKLIGINEAARVTCIKPSGTTTLVLGCNGSGIHAVHDEYYIRSLRVNKNESIYTYLLVYHPELLEDDYFKPHDTALIRIPQKAPEGSLLRTESALDLLERIKWFSNEWIKPGHITGNNSHNVSATISIKDDEWEKVGKWLWENRDCYNGLSVLPFDGGTYKQAPFESCSKEKYEELMASLTKIDLSQVVELDDNTDLKGEVACGANGCAIV